MNFFKNFLHQGVMHLRTSPLGGRDPVSALGACSWRGIGFPVFHSQCFSGGVTRAVVIAAELFRAQGLRKRNPQSRQKICNDGTTAQTRRRATDGGRGQVSSQGAQTVLPARVFGRGAFNAIWDSNRLSFWRTGRLYSTRRRYCFV